MKVTYAPEAVADLWRVADFVEAENPFAARRIALNLQEGVDRLRQFPKIGLPVLKAPDPEQIRDLYIGRYTARYLSGDEATYILRFWNNKENEFYSNEKGEPPHIHVQRERFLAKFWLNPVALASSRHFASHELRTIQNHVEEHRTLFMEAWNEHIGS